jgi:hypothetical protein
MFGPNKNQAAVYKYRLTDSGWACEWFIPWKDEAQSKAIAKGEQIPCGIGFEVGDDSELSDGKEQNVNIYFDQRQEICSGYYADYSKLSDITFVKGYDTEKNICTVAKKADIICNHCGEVVGENKTVSVSSGTLENHVWGASSESRAADCENDGLAKTECKYCGKVKEETVIPALGHSYEYSKREARHICVNCRDRAEHGDIDGDGSVTNGDVLEIYRYIYNPELYPVEYLSVADVNGDGTVDILDAVMIQKYAVDKISGFTKES